jgi:hypothetical protein
VSAGADGGSPFGPPPGNGLGKHNPYLANTNEILKTGYGNLNLSVCWDPSKQIVVAAIYFYSFALLAGYIIMSLFIGAVTGGQSINRICRIPRHLLIFFEGMADAIEECEIEDDRLRRALDKKMAFETDPK